MTPKQTYPIPHRTATIAMLAFLAALVMLFVAGMVGYFIMRFRLVPEGQSLHFPPGLWVSTGLILASSFTMSRALRAVRSERHKAFHLNLLITLGLSVAFVAVQTPALISLLNDHWRLSGSGLRLYGIVFSLILLHAGHVVGGLVGLVAVTVNAYRGRYDHEHYTGVQNCLWYWHFLDLVWLAMFLSMWAIG